MLLPESRRIIAIPVLLTLGVALNLVDPAFAGSVAVPAPILGAGLPGVAILGGVYGAVWLVRKLRKRRSTD